MRLVCIQPDPTNGKAAKAVLYENYTSNNDYVDWEFEEESSDLLITPKKPAERVRVSVGVPGYSFHHEFFLNIVSAAGTKKGDINGDDSIDILDVIRPNKSLLGAAKLTDETAADVDGDGSITSNDSLLILKYVLDMIESFNTK